jgi:hypothetical protein
MLGYCGLDCQKCEAYIATQTNDDTLRQKVADEWAAVYSVPIKKEDINCLGCRGEGVKVMYCEQMCEVRKCAMEKKVNSCSECSEYVCPKLEEIFKFGPEAKENLDGLRKEE